MIVRSIGHIFFLGCIALVTPATLVMAQDSHSGATIASEGGAGHDRGAGRGGHSGNSGDTHGGDEDHSTDDGHETDHGTDHVSGEDHDSDHASGGKGKGPKYKGGRDNLMPSARGHSLEDRVLRIGAFE